MSARCTKQRGLRRIKGYLGKLPHPRTYEEGAEILRRLMSAQFPKLTADQWLAAAQRTWHLKHGALKPAYDLGIARALAGIDVERPMPSLWNEFDALGGVPMLVDSRREFRLAFRRDGGGHARAAREHGHNRSRRPGTRTAARG